MKRVLLIEDEELISALLAKKLSEGGYDVTVAGDGEEGIVKAKMQNPDIVLLDMMLPRMNGLEVLQEMRDDADLRDTPVIIISNSGQPVEIEAVRKLGAKDWLVKTNFDPGEVLEKVRSYIG
ncbi:response regulator transcription factor [Patescibacteria group bacterium]|nr:response regulator transcription factor [Patescibacteria group bacterium]